MSNDTINNSISETPESQQTTQSKPNAKLNTKPNAKPKPIIAIICCHKVVEDENAQVVKDGYTSAIHKFGGIPVLLPAVLAEDNESLQHLLNKVDGILLTGSYSNVAPHWYGAMHTEDYTDLGRDKLSFQLIDYARKQNLPLLAICRGHQELNVAYGGILHPDYRVAGFTETHVYPAHLPKENEYQPIHDLWIDTDTFLGEFVEGFVENGVEDGAEGCLETPTMDNQAQIKGKWRVNSLHYQCIAGLGDELQSMAIAPDGLIEAIYDPKHPFMVGVQWHPEGCVEDELSQFLFSKFIEQANQFHSGKNNQQKSNYLVEARKLHKQAYAKWTDEADEKLAHLFKEGKTVKELMAIFERNRGAIDSRLKKLGLK